MSRGRHSGQRVQDDNPVAQDTDLSLESTGSQTLRGLRALGSNSSGYNPYESVPAGTGNGPGSSNNHGTSTSATGLHRIDEMRRLSEWIRAQRELAREEKKK